MNNTIAQLSGEEIFRFLEENSNLDFVNLVTALDRLAREHKTPKTPKDGWKDRDLKDRDPKDLRLRQLLGSLRRAIDDPNSLKRPPGAQRRPATVMLPCISLSARRHTSNTLWALSQLQTAGLRQILVASVIKIFRKAKQNASQRDNRPPAVELHCHGGTCEHAPV